MKSRVSVEQLLTLIPDSLLAALAEQSSVDRSVKKLTGSLLFKLLLFSLLESDRVSLRVMEELYTSGLFQGLLGSGEELRPERLDHSTLSDRLAHADWKYFEAIFHAVGAAAQERGCAGMRQRWNVTRFDSTVVGLSAKLLHVGFHTQNGEHREVKFTIGLRGFVPTTARLFLRQREISEDVALRKGILEAQPDENTIVVFDRGLQRRETFSELDRRGIRFVTRMKSRLRAKTVQVSPVTEQDRTDTLRVTADSIVLLRGEYGGWIEKEWRLIEGVTLREGRPVSFLTNITDLSAVEITEIYRLRWDIEVFFRFLKQELNFSHFLSRTENGIRIMLYATMTLALLILLYKQANGISGYKIATLRFAKELEMDMMQTIVLACGGDPSRMGMFARCDP